LFVLCNISSLTLTYIFKASIGFKNANFQKLTPAACIELYNSLIVYVRDFRCDEAYEHFNTSAIEKIGIKDFKNNLKRQKKRKKIFDERLSENMDLIRQKYSKMIPIL